MAKSNREKELMKAIKNTKIGRLGKEIKISPKAIVSFDPPFTQQTYGVESVSVLIGIGKDHFANLSMDKDSWAALNRGEPIHISTAIDIVKPNLKTKKKVNASKKN